MKNRVITVSFALITLGATVFCGCSRQKPIPFDQAAWLDADHSQAYSTMCDLMADDLMSNHIAVGMSTNDLIQLIGKPDKILTDGTEGGVPFPGAETYQWWLGSGYRRHKPMWDSMFLHVHIDEDGKVIGSRLNGY